jgi:hypothetical protein
MKTEHPRNTPVSVATLLATTLAVGPVSPALADRIPFIPTYSRRRARRQILHLLKLPGPPRAGEPSQFGR